MRKFDTIRRLALGATALAGLLPATAMASGFYIAEQSARGSGRAYSGEVADTGPDSLWWNPASIAGSEGWQVSVNASAILPSATLSDAGSTIGGVPVSYTGKTASSSNVIKDGVVPSGAVSYGLGNGFALGLSVTAPFNFTTDYGTGSWASYSATRTSLRTIDVQPSIGWEVTPGLRLGAGMNAERVTATLANGLPNGTATDGSETLHGTGWDYGFNAGAQYHTDKLTVGVAYRSSIRHSVAGTVAIVGSGSAGLNYLSPFTAAANFATPWQLTFGGRYAVTPAVTLNAQAVRSGWSKFDAINLNISGPLGAQTIPEGYNDVWSYSVGADVAVGPKLTLRAGVGRDMSPVVTTSRDARVPDSDRWVFAAGGSYKLTPHFTLDCAMNYLTLNDGTITRAAASALDPVAVNGTMTKASVLIFSVGGRASF